MGTKKDVIFEQQVRESLLEGVQILAKAVKTTLGPRGRNVLIDKGNDQPVITKDGITVAKSIVLKNRTQELGARLLRQAAAETGDNAGDGTTTATVLAEAIFSRGLQQVNSGAAPIALKRGLDKYTAKVVDFLKAKLSEPADDDVQIRQVGTIAANGEAQIGDLLLKALKKVGRDGTILLEEAQGFETELELIEGLQFDRGYLSAYFMTDPSTAEAVYEDVRVLVTSKVNNPRDMIPVLKVAAADQKPLLIIAEELHADVLNLLIVNRLKGPMPVVAVKAPGFGDRQKDMLADLAAATGATLIDKAAGIELGEKFDAKYLGKADKVIVQREETVLLGGKGDPAEIEGRASIIRKEIEELKQAKQEIQREFLEVRLAKLVGGIARINVGGNTEAEMNERKDRVEDALYATRAAVEEGILPGGGVALFRAALQVGCVDLEGEELLGAQLLKDALSSPMRQIVRNAGGSPDLVVEQLTKQLTGDQIGFNAATGEICNLVDAGVIDPTKVVRLALENAVSAAGTLLTTECMIVEAPEEDKI